jgi:hypothetical protein
MADGGDRVEGWNGKEGWRMGYWCSLTNFCSYKHTTEGDDLLITFVFPSSLPDQKKNPKADILLLSYQ